MNFFHRYNQAKYTYLIYIGRHVEFFCATYLSFALDYPPINMIIDNDGRDQFGFKHDNHLIGACVVFACILAILTGIVTKIMRRTFCLKTKYVLVKVKAA